MARSSLFSRFRALILVVSLLLLGVLVAMPGGMAPVAMGQGAQPKPIENVEKVLEDTQKAVNRIQESLKKDPNAADDAALASMRDALQKGQSAADDIVAQLAPQLADVQARIKQLGEPSTDVPEPPDIVAQRKDLASKQSSLDGQIKLARLLGVEAGQGVDQISQLRRQRFQAELGNRSESFFSPAFWADVKRDLPYDYTRLGEVGDQLAERLAAVPTRVWALAGALALLLVVVGEFMRRGLRGFTVQHTAPTRLRRSIFAVLRIAVYTLVPGLLASIALAVLRWEDGLDEAVQLFLVQCVTAIYMGGFVAGLGMALLSPRRPSWRLPLVSDALADRLSWLPGVFAATIAFAWVAQQLLALTNATLSTTLLVNGLMTLLLNVLIGFSAWTLRTSLRQQAVDAAAALPPDAESSPISAAGARARMVPSLLVAVIAASLTAFAMGFIALSTLIAQEIIWLSLIGSTAYLLVALVADIFDSLTARVRDDHEARLLSGHQARARSQLLVLVSGTLRLAVVVLAVTLVLLPFGENPTDWLHRRLGFLLSGFQVGQVQLRPTSILLTLGILLIGFYIVRVVRGWLADQFLPVTRLDDSMRTSAANLLSYLGYVAVVVVSISALGIGLERMAWVVSALSVGIGFGLQAVVQNFVSGVLLVAERPIKVGDWVSLDGGVEGNVRKISARATEIEMFDRSTMIVPNSEFITKRVRNVTLANPLGVVSLKFNMPLSTDADAVRDIMLDAIREQEEVLETPTPSVNLDGFTHEALMFSATCYVGSPRMASGVRSQLLFGILRRLRQADLALYVRQPADVGAPGVSGRADGDGEDEQGVGRKEKPGDDAPPLPLQP
ncbi:DUF3772 domain-containing protein [Pusillimonas sp. TS35]|uniref:DUF3772 domain-containing protein n=1 Tax=Paracandidimonas lactea TaxID=2895524 RepID=UPI001368525C|nr:DUF3772 domain-containing protein [Paracandidimonas lactea]MYN11687.1 DUF3772 domain-containing protein [Pusillimonas sp. TS35]